MVSKLLPSQFIFYTFGIQKRSYLPAVFTKTVLLSLNFLKFANKNKILPFINFDWLTKITGIHDGGGYLNILNKYLIFLLLFYLSKIEIQHNISDLWFKKTYIKIQLKLIQNGFILP